jgi:DNA-binding response OmpR family regulator
MDVSMPVMDGPTAARAIRELPAPVNATPIIALTANAMAGDRESYLADGMNDYVSKPIDLDALLAAIARQAPGAAIELSDRKPAPAGPVTSADMSEALDALNADLDALIAGLGEMVSRRSDVA